LRQIGALCLCAVILCAPYAHSARQLAPPGAEAAALAASFHAKLAALIDQHFPLRMELLNAAALADQVDRLDTARSILSSACFLFREAQPADIAHAAALIASGHDGSLHASNALAGYLSYLRDRMLLARLSAPPEPDSPAADLLDTYAINIRLATGILSRLSPDAYPERIRPDDMPILLQMVHIAGQPSEELFEYIRFLAAREQLERLNEQLFDTALPADIRGAMRDEATSILRGIAPDLPKEMTEQQFAHGVMAGVQADIPEQAAADIRFTFMESSLQKLAAIYAESVQAGGGQIGIRNPHWAELIKNLEIVMPGAKAADLLPLDMSRICEIMDSALPAAKAREHINALLRTRCTTWRIIKLLHSLRQRMRNLTAPELMLLTTIGIQPPAEFTSIDGTELEGMDIQTLFKTGIAHRAELRFLDQLTQLTEELPNTDPKTSEILSNLLPLLPLVKTTIDDCRREFARLHPDLTPDHISPSLRDLSNAADALLHYPADKLPSIIDGLLNIQKTQIANVRLLIGAATHHPANRSN